MMHSWQCPQYFSSQTWCEHFSIGLTTNKYTYFTWIGSIPIGVLMVCKLLLIGLVCHIRLWIVSLFCIFITFLFVICSYCCFWRNLFDESFSFGCHSIVGVVVCGWRTLDIIGSWFIWKSSEFQVRKSKIVKLFRCM